MKFYYNGQLIRTSKNHHYTHAVITRTEDGVVCHGCSSSEQGAEKLMNGLSVFLNYRKLISVQNGTYKPKDRWAWSSEKLKEYYIKEYGSVDKAVEHYKARVSKFEIVEIEEA